MAIGLFIVAGFILLILGVIFVFYLVSIYNGIIFLKNNISKSWSNIEVLLKQRTDELPNLVQTVKGYMKYERETLEVLVKARTSFLNATTMGEKAAANEVITNTLKTLFAVAENYPKLKASENFLALQKRISRLENEIADRREFFNNSVNNYNIRIQSFPDMIIAKIFGFELEELFKATEEEKQLIKVSMQSFT